MYLLIAIIISMYAGAGALINKSVLYKTTSPKFFGSQTKEFREFNIFINLKHNLFNIDNELNYTLFDFILCIWTFDWNNHKLPVVSTPDIQFCVNLIIIHDK